MGPVGTSVGARLQTAHLMLLLLLMSTELAYGTTRFVPEALECAPLVRELLSGLGLKGRHSRVHVLHGGLDLLHLGRGSCQRGSDLRSFLGRLAPEVTE